MSSVHWNYFLALEDDLRDISRYIEFTKDNFGTYSIENVKILMSAVQEIDVLFKEMCRYCDVKNRDINDYHDFVQSRCLKLFEAKVSLGDYSALMTPFKDWEKTTKSKKGAPKWWYANNDVKHQRNTKYSSASLENVLDAVSALLLVNVYYHVITNLGKPFEPTQNSVLFKLENEMLATGGNITKLFYRIP